MIWLLLACTSTPPDTAEPEGRPDIAPVEAGWLRGDLHFHTNYSGDALDQGGDWMAGALEIADAWRHPAWVDANPDLADDHLHFVAVTDHRTTEGMSDPDFQHDHLVLLSGEEFGSDGHAGIWGHTDHVPHDPIGDESRNQRLVDAISEAHAQGGLFSINHPLYDGDLWGWDTPGFDAIEIWNGPWSTLAAETDEAALDRWVEDHGVENPAIRAAVRAGGGGQNAQALRFWQAWLSLGAHVAPVGGGDRHMIFPAGIPTTYVLAESRDRDGVIAGLDAGHTFVTRSPQGPQVVLTAVVDGEEHPMGSALPGATEVEVRWEVARAAGGHLRLVHGVVDPALPDPEVEDVPIEGDRAAGSFTWTPPADGGWLHAVVVDPLPSGYPDDFQAAVDGLTSFPEESGATDLILAIGPYLDIEVLGDPSGCDADDWDPWSFQCMPTDVEPLGTFYVPDPLQRLMSAEFEDRLATGFAMGAVTAAFHTAPSD